MGSWIRELSREEAVQAFPSDVVGPMGRDIKGPVVRMWEEGARSPKIITVFGLIPELMLARIKLGFSMTFGGSGLGVRMEEQIATQVSGLLGCAY